MASGAIRGPTSSEQSDYCVATFYLYHAKDINRYVYGVQRSVSASEVTGTQTDIPHYEGVKVCHGIYVTFLMVLGMDYINQEVNW